MRKKSAALPGARRRPFAPVMICLFIAINLTAYAQGDAGSGNRQVICKMQVNGKKLALKANAGGYFQRIAGIEPGSTVPIELAYPDGKEGEKIVLAVLDGGRVNGDKVVDVVKLDRDQNLSFQLHLTNNTGLFRVLITRGREEKVVQVWAGAEMPSVTQ